MDIHKGAALYRTNDGRIVAEGDPDAAYLVAAEGAAIPSEYVAAVKAYAEANPDTGLILGTTEAQAEKRQAAPATTKRSVGPQENK